MRLYLSSFRMSDHPEHLAALVGDDGRRTVVIANANVFMLRYAVSRSGGDTVFREPLARDALVYAGCSAGPCVLSPSLRGLEAVDDADAVLRSYGSDPVWDGLALLDVAFVLHFESSLLQVSCPARSR